MTIKERIVFDYLIPAGYDAVTAGEIADEMLRRAKAGKLTQFCAGLTFHFARK